MTGDPRVVRAPSRFLPEFTVVLLDSAATGRVHVLQAPELASAAAHVVDVPDFMPGLTVRNVHGIRYAVFGSPGTEHRAVYAIGARRPDDTYPLTRIA